MVAHILVWDRNNSWHAAIFKGRLHKSLWKFNLSGEKLKEGSKTYKRINACGLCRTITTTPTPACTRTGSWVHYRSHRLITVHEARIAQGYPDTDLLVGTPKNKIHVIGSSVGRGVSLALGIGIREAYLASYETDKGIEAFDISDYFFVGVHQAPHGENFLAQDGQGDEDDEILRQPVIVIDDDDDYDAGMN